MNDPTLYSEVLKFPYRMTVDYAPINGADGGPWFWCLSFMNGANEVLDAGRKPTRRGAMNACRHALRTSVKKLEAMSYTQWRPKSKPY